MTQLVEPRPTQPDEVALLELPRQRALVVRVEGSAAELPRLVGEAFRITAAAIEAAGARYAGPPFTRYHSFGERIVAESGFPFDGEISPTEGVKIAELPGGRTLISRHVGAYDTLPSAWEGATAWMAAHDLKPSGPGWECYLTGPDEPEPPVTEINWPLT